MNKEYLNNIIDNIEDMDDYADLDICEKIYIVYKLLKNVNNCIAPYMIDGEQDEEDVQEIKNIIERLKNIIE